MKILGLTLVGIGLLFMLCLPAFIMVRRASCNPYEECAVRGENHPWHCGQSCPDGMSKEQYVEYHSSLPSKQWKKQ